LADVKQVFADRYDLHSRIDMALSKSSVSRIAVVPLKCHRKRITGVLDAVLADPLGDQNWFHQLRGRLLAKDAIIRYSDRFEYIGTHNSLVEFPTPFKVPKRVRRPEDYEIMECSSVRDSYDHLKSCQLHVFVASSLSDALSSPVPSPYPSVLVVDDPAPPGPRGGNAEEDAPISDLIIISSETAIKGNELLATSAENVSQYLDQRKASNIEAVEKIIFQPRAILNEKLVETVAQTCELLVAPRGEYTSRERDVQLEQDIARVKKARTKWAEDAHRELQTGLVQEFDKLRFHTLAWWKLYWRADDVGDIAEASVRRSFLPDAQQRFSYITGQIDAQAERDYGALPASAEIDEIARVRDATAASISTTLHNGAVKLLATVVFGIQLPSVVIPLLGMYFYGYTLWAMGSLMALGIVIGLRTLQRGWLKLSDACALRVTESARAALSVSERRIWERYEKTVLFEQGQVDKKVALISELRDVISA
jgi:hypothetical protein